jgi:hypothetical protein
MATFKQYMAAKTKVNEQKVPKTMNQNFFIRKELNEYDGEASMSGGGIDALVFGALALIGRTMKNGMTYMKLQSLKGPYLQQYELCGSSQSRTVFDDEYKGGKLDDYKQAEIELKEKKEQIRKQIKVEKNKIEGRSESDTKRREALDKKAEIAIIKIEQDEQKIKVAKSRLDDEVSNKWDQEKRTLDELKDKITKAENGFLLGGTFKKRWENGFAEAKLDIDEKVTALAREILSARGDKDAVADLNAKEAKLKEEQAELEAEAKELKANEEDDKAIEALKLVPTLPKLNAVKEEFSGFLNNLKSQYQPEAEKEAPKQESKSYIIEEDENKDASPSEVIGLMSKAYNNQEEDDKPAFAAKIVKNIEAIKDFKQKIADTIASVADECDKNADNLPSDIKGPFLKDGKVKEEITKNVTEVKDLYNKELEDFKEKSEGKKEDKGEGETTEETNEVKEKKAKVEQLKDEVEKIKSAMNDVKDKNKKGIFAASLPNIEKRLQKAEEELEAAKNKSKESSEKTESIETEIPKKFMKFEDYLNIKEKNK